VNTDHFIKRCRHGTLVTQCRCPHKDKRVITVACPGHCPTKAPPGEVILWDQSPVKKKTKETDEYEWPLTGERLRMWGQDA